jgi:hypothetical protein
VKRLLVLVLLLTGIGCAHREPLPRYPLQDPVASLEILRERSAKIRTASGTVAMTLTDAKGEEFHIEGAFALDLPDSARLRAWKFGQAIFDLTIRPDGVWALASRKEAQPAMRGATRSLQQWATLLRNDFPAESIAPQTSDKQIVIVRPSDDGQHNTRVEIDRATLTTRRFAFTADRNETFEILLSDYRVLSGGTIWPHAMVAKGASGTVKVTFGDVEVNQPLAPAAFKPPAKAEKLP